MRSIRSIGATLGAITLLALPAAAQSSGTFDVGVFGRINWLDNSYETKTGFGGGARVGYFFKQNLEATLDFSTSSNGQNSLNLGNVTYTPVHIRLNYFVPLKDKLAFLIGAGYTYESFSGSGKSDHDNAIGGIVGLRMTFGHDMYALLDYTGDYSSNPVNTANSSWNSGVELGIGWYLGGAKKEAAAPAAAAPAPAPAPAPTPAPAVVATPVAAAVVPPADDDKDGVPNTADKCLNTPAGEAVDANGCSDSQKDDDHDGVMNNVDKCPNTPAGTEVDMAGCRVAPLVLKGVNFETAKAVLLPSASATLDTVATALLAHPKIKITISGYTDNVGDSTKNVKLSQARAEAVKAYLVSKGVAADRLVAKGFGPANPAEPNTTAAGRATNRRVEVQIISE